MNRRKFFGLLSGLFAARSACAGIDLATTADTTYTVIVTSRLDARKIMGLAIDELHKHKNRAVVDRLKGAAP